MVSLLFSLLFFVFGVFFLFVVAWATYGAWHVLRNGQRQRRYLAESEHERPLQLEHLSAPLAVLVEDTRLLRVSLEAPIRDLGDLRQGEFPRRAAEDLDTLDNMLLNVSRQILDWVHAVDRLGDVDRGALLDAGVSPERVRNVLESEGGSFERRNVGAAGRPPMDQRLGIIAAELGQFERALQFTVHPYR